MILLQFGEQGRGFTCGRMLAYMCEALGLVPSTTERKQPSYGTRPFVSPEIPPAVFGRWPPLIVIQFYHFEIAH